MVKISVVTVGMNHRKYLEALYHSLYIANKPQVSFEAIYVDNCSKDDSVNFIKNNYPQVKIITNNKICGFGENNNRGVMASQGEYIAIINPDIVCQKDSIDVLYNYLVENPNVGIVAPQLLNPDLSIQYSVRSFMSLKMLFYRLLSKGNDLSCNTSVSDYLCKNLDFNKTQPVDWAMGAALMLSKHNYAKLGGFDQDYFLYVEDEDLSLRSWKSGMPVIYVPCAKMIHNHLRGSSKLGKKTFMHIKSMCIFFKKHGFNINSYRSTYNIDR